MQEEVHAWVESGQLLSAQADHVIRQPVLTRFVAPDGVHGDDYR
ncbi:MAG: hypothetical protein ACREOH_09180 [Candidatus Entotheonellia bacterium]